jgi:NTE family protein
VTTSAARVAQGAEVVVALGGGAALGAYHLGACARLLDAGVEPARWIGASIGAVTAAILVGNPPETRLDRLRDFWRLARQPEFLGAAAARGTARARLNSAFAVAALAFGRPGLFTRRWPGPWSLLPGAPPDLGLRDHGPMARTLERLLDFGRLNDAPARVSALALDLETGRETWFDTRAGGIRPEHLLAATAFAPLFPPVEIGGRLFCDAGFANNLPFDHALAEPAGPTLCFALDVYALEHGRPGSIDETVARVQDIAFAAQTRRALDGVARQRRLLRLARLDSPPVTVAHLAYAAPGHQRTLKPLDFSASSLDERARRGAQDMTDMLARLAVPRDDAPFTYLGPHDVADRDAPGPDLPKPDAPTPDAPAPALRRAADARRT